jgi:hypothetical protein
MDYRAQLDSKLTPAAKQALEELVHDYHEQLLIGAAESAERFGELREISVHDIMAGMGRQQSRLFGTTGNQVERMLRWNMLGVVVGGGMAAVSLVLMRTSPNAILVWQMGGVLIAMSAGSYAMLLIMKLRRTPLMLRGRRQEFDQEGDISSLALWRDLEIAIRRAAAVQLGESGAAGSISKLLEQLGRTDLLAPQDQDALKRLLALRNAIAHGRPVELDRASVRDTLRQGARLLERLRTASQEP